MVKSQPLVSICCTAYNHEKFIRDAIEGFLIQHTNFDFEIIIHDDASTDDTAEIIKEYEKKYPELFVTIFQKENQYSQGIKPWSNFVFPKARGKYIALCEGDDYWTDPLKLQKQVDFLEENKDFAACFHNYSQLINNSKKTKENPISTLRRDSKDNIILKSIFDSDVWITQTCTVVFRTSSLEKIDLKKFNSPYGDFVLFYNLLKGSYGYWLKDNMAVYRTHEEGVYSRLNDETKKINLYNLYFKIYKNNLDDKIAGKYYKSNAAVMISQIKNGSIDTLKVSSVLKDALSISIVEFFQVLVRHYFYRFRFLVNKLSFK